MKLPKIVCRFCGWKFNPRVENPKRCPHCRNDWRKERKREIKK